MLPWGMPDHSREPEHPSPLPKRPRDSNDLAFSIVAQLTGATEACEEPAGPQKDPAAVALGRRGGLKGGHARAAKMTAGERVESAKKAALARWAKKA